MKLSLPEHFRQMSGLHSCIYGMQQAVMWQCWRTVRKRTPSGMAAEDGQLRSIDSRLLLLLLGGEPAGTTGMALLGGKAGKPADIRSEFLYLRNSAGRHALIPAYGRGTGIRRYSMDESAFPYRNRTLSATGWGQQDTGGIRGRRTAPQYRQPAPSSAFGWGTCRNYRDGTFGRESGDGIVSPDVAAADTVSDKVLLVHKHRDR